MDSPHAGEDLTRTEIIAGKLFLRLETWAYLIVGVAFAAVAVLGIGKAVTSLWDAIGHFDNAEFLVVAIDHLLLVLMVVEILHTLRESFRSGALVCEPFLVVGLIASIRRILVITLESSQMNQPDKWSSNAQSLFSASMLELGVLGGLVLVMVIAIYVLRRSEGLLKNK